MSATPRIYDLEYINYEIEDSDKNDYDDNNYIINLGEITYSMNFTTAIEQKYITDYSIYLPSISETNSELINDINSDSVT